MSKIKKSLLCLGLMAGAALSASAYTLVSPQPGETHTVSMLTSITLKWDVDDVEAFPEGTVTVLDSSNTQVATGTCDYDNDDYSAYTVTIVPAVVTPGTYTVVIPANMSETNDNPEYRLTYKVEGSNADPCEPTLITPQSGTTIVQDVENFVNFNSIRLDFGNDPSLTINQQNITFTNESGTPVPYEIGGWYLATDPMLAYADNPFVTFNFNDDGTMPSGTYTLTCKPGTFTSPLGIGMKEIVLTYNYTRTQADADETPLEITSALLGEVKSATGDKRYEWVADNAETITPDMVVEEFTGILNVKEGENATGILFTINHADKSGYVNYALIESDSKDVIYTSECEKQEDGSFLIGWVKTTKLVEGKTYDLEIHAYDNIQNKIEFGQGASLTFKGASKAFQYSTAEFVTVVPTSGSTITKLSDNKITVLFTEPVKVSAGYALGMGAGTSKIDAESATGEEYDNVWYVYLPEYAMKTYPELNVSVQAYDREGRIVKGNTGGVEADSKNSFDYALTFCQPRVLLTQTNSHVPAINTFVAYASNGKGIYTSYMAYPYVIDEDGNEVAKLNQEYYTDPETKEKVAFKPLSWTSASEYDADPLEIEFQMTPAITKKGKYTLVLPSTAFNIGNQFDSDISVEQTYDFYVVDFVGVSYSVDNCTVALPQIESGKTATLELTPAKGWKLESLKLNDKDVTKDVVNGLYTSPAATVAQNFYATFAYDGVTYEPASADEIVSDLKLRGWSQGGSLYVAGLKDGQVINVFSMGGNLMETVNVSSDTMKITVPAGIYVLTVTEGNKTVALKLVNK